MLHAQLYVYMAKAKQYKQSAGYPELPNFMLPPGKRDWMETMGNEQRQRQRMKTRIRGTKRDFPGCSGSVATVGNEEGNTDEP